MGGNPVLLPAPQPLNVKLDRLANQRLYLCQRLADGNAPR